MRVRYQPHVRARLREIFLYISQDGPRPVIRFRARLATAQRRVSLFPLSGSKVPEWPEKPLREFLIGEYRFFYFIDERRRTVWILDIWHGAQLAQRPELPAPSR